MSLCSHEDWSDGQTVTRNRRHWQTLSQICAPDGLALRGMVPLRNLTRMFNRGHSKVNTVTKGQFRQTALDQTEIWGRARSGSCQHGWLVGCVIPDTLLVCAWARNKRRVCTIQRAARV